METIRPSHDKLKDRNVANIVSSSKYKKSGFLSMIEKDAHRVAPGLVVQLPLVLIVLPALPLIFGVGREGTRTGIWFALIAKSRNFRIAFA
jgi:hypothetical protein